MSPNKGSFLFAKITCRIIENSVNIGGIIMKKLFACLLVVLAVMLTGCMGEKTNGSLSKTDVDRMVEELVEQTEYDGYKQGYIVNASYSDETREAESFKVALRNAIEDEIKENPNETSGDTFFVYNNEVYAVEWNN